MANDCDIVAGSSTQGASVSHLLFDVADNGSFRYRAKRQNVSDGQCRILTSVDELAGIHALICDECFFAELEAIRITEGDVGKRGAATGIVDDVFDNTTDIPMSLSVVEGAELCRSLVQPGVAF